MDHYICKYISVSLYSVSDRGKFQQLLCNDAVEAHSCVDIVAEFTDVSNTKLLINQLQDVLT